MKLCGSQNVNCTKAADHGQLAIGGTDMGRTEYVYHWIADAAVLAAGHLQKESQQCLGSLPSGTMTLQQVGNKVSLPVIPTITKLADSSQLHSLHGCELGLHDLALKQGRAPGCLDITWGCSCQRVEGFTSAFCDMSAEAGSAIKLQAAVGTNVTGVHGVSGWTPVIEHHVVFRAKVSIQRTHVGKVPFAELTVQSLGKSLCTRTLDGQDANLKCHRAAVHPIVTLGAEQAGALNVQKLRQLSSFGYAPKDQL